MSRETLKPGRQTLTPNKETTKQPGTLKDFATGIAAGMAIVSGLADAAAYSGERAAESILIDKARVQLREYVDLISTLDGFATDINNQQGCIANLNAIRNILNRGGLSIALSEVEFTVVCVARRTLYKWEFIARPVTNSQIRRDTDPIDVKLITAPNYGDNPILTEIGSNMALPVTYVIPKPKWRY